MKNDRNQVVMPINLEIKIPEDDPARLVDEICEALDYTKVYMKSRKEFTGTKAAKGVHTGTNVTNQNMTNGR